jgi:hypothetical protein
MIRRIMTMKKKIYGVLLTLAFAGLITGCGKSEEEPQSEAETSPVKDEIVSFVNDDLASIQSDRNDAVEIYNSYFSQDKVDLDKFKSDLEDTAIPKMKDYVDSLSLIEPESDEVKNLKELYYMGAELQYEAMVMVSSALDTENPEFLTQANELISQSESYITQYESQLRLLTVDYDIDVNGTFTSAADSSQDESQEETSEETPVEE